MCKLQRYSEYAPTGFDRAGSFLDDRQRWYVGPGRNRDSDQLTESNFATALALLGGESDTVEVHRFGHWACGWLEVIIAHPRRGDALQDIAARLADYPVLDEDDYSRREFEDACEAWDRMGTGDRMDLCSKAGVSVFAARRESPYDADPGNGAITDRLLGR